MAGLAARTARNTHFLYKKMAILAMMVVGGEREI
jgi:hypothetical protein